jgi:hypothetical protein
MAMVAMWAEKAELAACVFPRAIIDVLFLFSVW